MAGRRTNLALLALLAGALVTGFTAYGIGTSSGRVVAIAHGVLGLGILLLSPWKQVVIRRGLARRRPGRVVSIFLSFVIVVAVLFGIGHSTGILRSVADVTAMQLHVGAALVAVPVAVWHVLVRPVRVRRTDLSRRSLLRAGAVLGGAGLAYAGLEGVVRVASLSGADRRFTGSFERGSFDPERMPVTQWLDDSVQHVDPSSWSLEVAGENERRLWSYDELSSFEDHVTTTIDCTGGWYSEQDWEGVWLARLLDGSGGRSISVGSLSGYSRRFPIGDAGSLLVATRVGGDPLSPGHGFPARIVAPGRRGFWWVKWLSSIETDDRPWWLQSPFPLT